MKSESNLGRGHFATPGGRPTETSMHNGLTVCARWRQCRPLSTTPFLGSTALTHTAMPHIFRSLQWTAPYPPQRLLLLMRQLERGSLGLPDPPLQTTFPSTPPFFQNSLSLPTDRPTSTDGQKDNRTQPVRIGSMYAISDWLCGTVVERWFLAGELSLSHAGLAADG